ncbi:hypothetical protein Trydic_g13602 [Trypoxylus dichotomus]
MISFRAFGSVRCVQASESVFTIVLVVESAHITTSRDRYGGTHANPNDRYGRHYAIFNVNGGLERELWPPIYHRLSKISEQLKS